MAEPPAGGAGGQPAAQPCEGCADHSQDPAGLGAREHVDPRIKRRLVEPNIAIERGPFQDAARSGDAVRLIRPQNAAMAKANGRQQGKTCEPERHVSAEEAWHASSSPDAKQHGAVGGRLAGDAPVACPISEQAADATGTLTGDRR